MLINEIITQLGQTPAILSELVDSVDESMLKERRIKGKWSVHEHACHIVHVQRLFDERIEKFVNEDKPNFEIYIPGKTTDKDELMNMNLKEVLGGFSKKRATFLERLKTTYPEIKNREGSHTQYKKFTPYIMARHFLLHDYTHMFRIEELWLTKNLG